MLRMGIGWNAHFFSRSTYISLHRHLFSFPTAYRLAILYEEWSGDITRSEKNKRKSPNQLNSTLHNYGNIVCPSLFFT